MAICSPQELMNSAQCFAVLPPYQLEIVNTALLCRLLQEANPMASCNVQDLFNSAQCLWTLSSQQLQIVQTQLLCELINAGGIYGCLLCSPNADPVNDPHCACALYYRRDNGTMWYWDATTATWVPLIGP